MTQGRGASPREEPAAPLGVARPVTGAPGPRAVLAVAAAGYGKSTSLRRGRSNPCVDWESGLDLFTSGQGGLVDDLGRLSVPDAQRLLAAIEAAPPGTDIALASRHPLPVSAARLRGRGVLQEVGPADLALSQDATADLLAADYGLRDPDQADQVHEATAGWPALVRLTGEALAAGGQILPEPGGPLWSFIRDEVLGELPDSIGKLVTDLADLAPVSAGVAEVLGHPDAAESIAYLTRVGILAGDRLVPAVAFVARGKGVAQRTIALAGQWYAQHGPPVAALRAFDRAGRIAQCGRIVAAHGETILASGHASAIIDIVGRFPDRTRPQQLLLGDALRISGAVLSAAQAYAVVADAEPVWDAGLAWRMGLVHYLRGDSHAALKAFARADEAAAPKAARAEETIAPKPARAEETTAPKPAAGAASDQGRVVDHALLQSWQACAHLQLGETVTAKETAAQACRTATAAKDDTALATAYISLALCQTVAGENTDSEELYAQALSLAERGGNVILQARILTSQTYQLICEARYAEALEAARRTAHCAGLAGHTNMRSIALCNEGDALLMLGRYDEAIRQYDRARALCRRMGSRRSAAAQLGLGEVYRRRGWLEQARAAYESAIQLAEESGLSHVRVGGLSGLARVLADGDIDTARGLADQAAAIATDRAAIYALVAQGWIAWHAGNRGDGPHAADLAGEAAKAARAMREPAGLAEALELRAAAETDLKRSRAALREALAIWAGAGAVVEAARVRYRLGHLPDADTDERLSALAAAETLAAAGVPVTAADARPTDSDVVVRAFGRFEVVLRDEVVPPASWQSRKARDLLRILVARRGRPVPRNELSEMLWPDDDPTKTGHRLSVLLSIVKGVLDPEKAYPTDHFVVADQASIGLEVTRLRIDVEEFLTDAGHGRRLRERGALAEAFRLLSNAVQAYRADVFEDEPYADWSSALREEARAAYVSSLRILAFTGRRIGRSGAAVDYLLRLLAIDPYDEAGHRALIETLVAGGQHGEARRAFTRYREAMLSIGVKPTYQYQEPMQVP